MRVTPLVIRNLQRCEIFCFGSNLQGRHGKGAAKSALKWGAIYGQGEGLQGRTYGIPTKKTPYQSLTLIEIKEYIKKFIDFADLNPDLIFLVTPIGCNNAGYTPEQIAPLFMEAKYKTNIFLPDSFWNIILRNAA